jgi:hypothetical protein
MRVKNMLSTCVKQQQVHACRGSSSHEQRNMPASSNVQAKQTPVCICCFLTAAAAAG